MRENRKILETGDLGCQKALAQTNKPLIQNDLRADWAPFTSEYRKSAFLVKILINKHLARGIPGKIRQTKDLLQNLEPVGLSSAGTGFAIRHTLQFQYDIWCRKMGQRVAKRISGEVSGLEKISSRAELTRF